MRALTVVVLAACSSPAVKKTEHPPAPVSIDAGVVVSDAAVAAVVDAAPADYALPKAVVDALAKEKVTGNVIAPTWHALYPTLNDARDPKMSFGEPYDRPEKLMALRVIADHGDVIEVSTEQDEKDKPIDCEPSMPLPYVVTAFIRRDELLLRSAVAQSQTYPDGTAVTIDAGAAIAVTPKGLAWRTPLLAATKLTPREDQLSFSGPPAPAKGALAAMPGEQLYCDDFEWGKAMTAAEAPKPKKGEQLYGCGAFDPPELNPENKSLPPPTLGGVPVPWDAFRDRTFRVHRQPDKRVLADVESKCGRVRLVVDPGAVSGGGMEMEFGVVDSMIWVPAKGPVTWEDGTPAGRYVGTLGLEDPRKLPEKKPTQLCTSIRPIAGWLCHPLRTAKKKKAKPIRHDDTM